MDKRTIDQLGPIYSDDRLIEKIPQDTQIVLIGDFYINSYHQQYVYLNLPDFAARGFHYAFGQKNDYQHGAKYVVDQMGYRPYHMHRYRHVDLTDKREVMRQDDVTLENYNALYGVQNGAGHYKLLKAATRLGMGFSFIEDPTYDSGKIQNGPRMSKRAAYMADTVTDLMQEKKRILIHCGEDFLYSAPDLDGVDHSLQELLQQRGFKTHTIALINEPGELLLDNDETVAADYIENADAGAAQFIDEWARNQISNPDDLDDDNAFDTQPYFNEMINVFLLDARVATDRAGTILPDRFAVFPQASFDHSNSVNEYQGAKFDPVREDRYWCKAWTKHGIPAQRLYKQQRKNTP